MENIWNRIQGLASADYAMADAFKQTLTKLREGDAKHRFSTKEIADIFIGEVHGDDQTDGDQGLYLADMFQKWRKDPRPVTLPELLFVACDYFDIAHDHAMLPAALTSCVLGEIPHDNPYHNSFHFREVFALMMRFCAYHNASDHVADKLKLSDSDILFLLICAAIHDFAHDGSTNFVDGEHNISRLEKQSVHLTLPYLHAAGMPLDMAEALLLVIISTDTTRNSDGRSPAGLVRDIYLAHEHETLSVLDVPDDYRGFVESHKISLMARMLCEADITPSSGISYQFSKKMTVDLSLENAAVMPAATTLYVFMEVICHGGYDTPAAKALLGEKFKEILQAVRNDSVNGVLYS